MSECDNERSQSLHRWVLFATFVLSALLQLTLAPRQSLWTDEIFSLAIATGHSLEHPAAVADVTRADFQEPVVPVPAEQLRRYLQHEQPPTGPERVIRAVLLSDTSPPLYYLLLYGWTSCFGTSDLALRLLSVLFSLASFPLIAAIARRTIGRKSVLPVCLLFALSPIAIYFGNEARMYSLLVFCVVATVWISVVLSQDGYGPGHYILWITTSAAGFLTHYFFIFPWLAVVAYFLLNPGKFRLRSLLAAMFAVPLLVLPWYLQVPDQMSRWRVTKDWLKLSPPHFSFIRTAAKQFLQFFSCEGSGLWSAPAWSSTAALILFICIILLMLWRLSFRAISGWPLLLWLWFIAASAGPIVIDFIQKTYSSRHPRYSLAALPAAYLIAGFGLSRMGRLARGLALIVIAALWAPSLAGVYRKRSRGNQPFRQLAQLLDYTTNASDVILVHSIPAGVLGVARYSNTPAGIASWVEQLGSRHAPDAIKQLAAGHPRVYYVRIEHTLREARPEEEWLQQNAGAISSKQLQAITVTEFKPRNAGAF